MISFTVLSLTLSCLLSLQEHRQGKISSTVLARFGNKDNIDTVLGRVERIWFPGIAEDKLRVKWKVPQVSKGNLTLILTGGVDSTPPKIFC